jgi:predicted kinase
LELIIFSGLQASGKSTFYRAQFAATHELVSKDLLGKNRHKQRLQEALITAALQAGHSVVVDNTNATVADRAPLILLGQTYGATIIGYYFDSALRDALARNRRREGQARVPDVALYATMKKLTRPTLAEGFARLFTVSITGEGTFALLANEEMEK